MRIGIVIQRSEGRLIVAVSCGEGAGSAEAIAATAREVAVAAAATWLAGCPRSRTPSTCTCGSGLPARQTDQAPARSSPA